MMDLVTLYLILFCPIRIPIWLGVKHIAVEIALVLQWYSIQVQGIVSCWTLLEVLINSMILIMFMFLTLRLSQVMEVELEIRTSSIFPTMRKSHDDNTPKAIKSSTSQTILSYIEVTNFNAPPDTRLFSILEKSFLQFV